MKVFNADGSRRALGEPGQGRNCNDFPKKSLKGYKERFTFHLPSLLEQLQERSASSPLPGGTLWALSDSPEHQHEFLHPAGQLPLPAPDWPKTKPCFSEISARTACSVLKNHFSSHPALMWGKAPAYGAENAPANVKGQEREGRLVLGLKMKS